MEPKKTAAPCDPVPTDDSSFVDLLGPRPGRSSIHSRGPRVVPARETPPPALGSPAALLDDLLRTCLIHPTDWRNTPPPVQAELAGLPDTAALLERLVALELLTPYQAKEIEAGGAATLLLGNYRVLDQLGAGGAGVVLKGQHLRFRRPVAIKVITAWPHQDPQVLPRFFGEMEAIGQLRHPHIVTALDAGEVQGPDARTPVIHYLVMEYVAGENLADWVRNRGPLAPAQACALIHQAAGALAEAHKHHLVHRDVKPSNIIVTAEGQAKLVDFGLARHFGNRMTEPGVPMGTIDYMAPEQVQDSSAVDERADVFGLGGTLFWCLTGQTPFPTQGTATEKLYRRLMQAAATVRNYRPDIPAELDALVARMLATNPDDRPPSMTAVQRALFPFLRPETQAAPVGTSSPAAQTTATDAAQHRVLIVDDDPVTARMNQRVLERIGLPGDVAPSGEQALEAVRGRSYDLVLLDIQMPGLSGLDVLTHLRQAPPSAHLKVIMCSGSTRADEMAQMLLAGADDFLTKPTSAVQLQARVKTALLLKEAQDRSDALNRQLLAINTALEKDLHARESHLLHARNALVQALARLVQHRTSEAGARLRRLQRYCCCLAEEAARLPHFAGRIDPDFVRLLESCVPLHDIGKVAMPDHILLKPGKLDAEERLIMQTHTTIGADVLKEVADRYQFALPFLQMAIDIARHHHERFDGTGYPGRLVGGAIPLEARIVALADAYDGLRSRRPYRPALPHAVAVRLMVEESAGQFDPSLLQVFQRCADQFEKIFREVVD